MCSRQFFQLDKTPFPASSVVLSLMILLISSLSAIAGRLYVDVTSTAISPDGLSWTTAFPKFETAVSTAVAGDEIWVAKGTYQPVSGASYTLKTGVRIYGGFTNLDTQISSRNWETNLTILKGNGNRVFNNLDIASTALLDGFTISDGANGFFYGGAGMCNERSSPTLTNIIFRDNKLNDASYTYGAGLFNTTASSPVLTNVKFIDNVCKSLTYFALGAGMYNQDNSFPVLNNVIFSGNRCEAGTQTLAYSLGAGIYNSYSTPVYNNVVFSNNVCTSEKGSEFTYGGGMYNSHALTSSAIANVVFSGNVALSGAAIYCNDSNINLTHGTFSNNLSGDPDEASYAIVVYKSTVKISNSVFLGHSYDVEPQLPLSTIIENSFVNLPAGVTVSNTFTSTQSPFRDDENPKGPDGIWMTEDDGLSLAYDAGAAVDGAQTLSTPAFPANMVTAALKDIRGMSRPVGTGNDMGAYEGVIKQIIYAAASHLSGTQDGLSWATAFTKLEDALTAAKTDTRYSVWVAAGTYQPPIGTSFSMNASTKIYGGFTNMDTEFSQRNWETNQTILTGNGAGAIDNDFDITGIEVSAKARLDGFMITGGRAGSKGGGGMYNYKASPNIKNVKFIANESTGDGGAILNKSSFPVLEKLVFENNTAAGKGGAIANIGTGSYKINNTIFSNNTALHGGALANTDAQPELANVVFTSNSATDDGAVFYNTGTTNVRVVNATFYNNTSAQGGIFANVGTTVTPAVTIGNGVFRSGSTITDSSPAITYSLAESTITGTGNQVLAESPFADETLPKGADGIWMTSDDGLRLKYNLATAQTTAINTGKTVYNTIDVTRSMESAVQKDITDFPRPSGPGFDKGAYEYRYTTEQAKHIYVDGTHTTGLSDGRSWATAYNKLETGLADAGLADGGTVWVAKGTYQPPIGTSYQMKKGVAIYGGMLNTYTDLAEQAPLTNPTILKGNGNSVINNTFTAGNEMTSSAVLDGFTVQDGVSDGNGAGINNAYASPTLRNLIIKNNTTEWGDGGGIALKHSESQLMNVTVENNLGYIGGGIDIKYSTTSMINVILKQNTGVSGGGVSSQESSCQLINVVFDRNKVDLDYGVGGGFYLTSGPAPAIFQNVIFYGNEGFDGAGISTYESAVQLTNTTFYKNIATGSGGAANFYSQPGHLPSIANSIFWGNTGATGSQDIFLAEQSVNMINSFTQSDFSGKSATNIQGTASPFFNESAPMGPDGIWLTEDDGLQLSTCSPALNSGNNDAAAAIGVDIVENSRIKNATIDMGVYESQNAPASGSYETHAALSENNANELSLVPTCDDNGWTYYADPTHPDNFVFAINWGTENDAAKAAATVNIKLSETNKEAFTTDKGIVAMRRYWNVDLDGSELAHSVQVRFYYDAADVADMETAVEDASLVAKDGEVKWFKTTDNLYDPSQITATQINGGGFEMLTPLYGTDNDVAYAQFDDVGSFSGGAAVILAEKAPSLPVTLVSFNARQTESKANLLTWNTIAEKDFSHFEIQHSVNANVFAEIGKVPGNHGPGYQFIHANPIRGLNYYRLRMVDTDGSFAFSRILSVTNEGDELSAGNFYPNPVAGKNTAIDISTAEKETWQMQTFSISGILLKSGTVSLKPGFNTIMFDFKGLPTGIHLVKFSNEQGQEFVRKIVIE